MGRVSTGTFTSDTETVTRTKLNNLVANLLTEFNGSIDDENIKAAANIAASKLNLATIAQDVTITGELVSSESTTASALVLTNTGNGPHINFTGDPTVSSPSDGDLWFTGTDLRFRIGATTYTVDLTAA